MHGLIDLLVGRFMRNGRTHCLIIGVHSFRNVPNLSISRIPWSHVETLIQNSLVSRCRLERLLPIAYINQAIRTCWLKVVIDQSICGAFVLTFAPRLYHGTSHKVLLLSPADLLPQHKSNHTINRVKQICNLNVLGLRRREML